MALGEPFQLDRKTLRTLPFVGLFAVFVYVG